MTIQNNNIRIVALESRSVRSTCAGKRIVKFLKGLSDLNKTQATLWYRDLSWNAQIFMVGEKIPSFYVIRRFITLFTERSHWTALWVTWILFILSHTFLWFYVLSFVVCVIVCFITGLRMNEMKISYFLEINTSILRKILFGIHADERLCDFFTFRNVYLFIYLFVDYF
jgi:hypothetical protein